jgi:hypothetical protein
MWHIPISATERTLLYVAETFEQFAILLIFFDAPDNQDSFDWWEAIATDIEKITNMR